MQWQHCFQTGNGPLLIAGQKQAVAAGSPDRRSHRRSLQMRSGFELQADPRPRPINKDRFTRIFLSDAVTTEFPSPGDDRIQFHAVSLLEASIFNKSSEHQELLLTPFGVAHPLPYHQEIVRQKQDSKHTQHTKKRIASRVVVQVQNQTQFLGRFRSGGRRGIWLTERGSKKKVQLSFVITLFGNYNLFYIVLPT